MKMEKDRFVMKIIGFFLCDTSFDQQVMLNGPETFGSLLTHRAGKNRWFFLINVTATLAGWLCK